MLEYGSTLSIQTSLLNIGCLLHKMGFVQREIATTVDMKYLRFEMLFLTSLRS